MPLLQDKIIELGAMKKYPDEINYIGNLELLKRKKVSIVGTRHPNQYTKMLTQEIARKLSLNGVCIVSGGAMGVDALAHHSAGVQNTIMVAGTGIDIRYPKINKKLIEDIENNGLVLSQFKSKTPSNKYNFPLRNELVVALGDILVVTQADLKSGTMRSVEYALKMKKKIYVLAHRIGESAGTNNLLNSADAKAIYDIDAFIQEVSGFNVVEKKEDEFLDFCETFPSYEDALVKYPLRVFEAELSGEISIKNGKIFRV